MKKRFRKKDDDGYFYLTPFEEAALIYLIKHTKIVKFKKNYNGYTIYVNNKLVPDILLSERFLVELFFEVYEVK